MNPALWKKKRRKAKQRYNEKSEEHKYKNIRKRHFYFTIPKTDKILNSTSINKFIAFHFYKLIYILWKTHKVRNICLLIHYIFSKLQKGNSRPEKISIALNKKNISTKTWSAQKTRRERRALSDKHTQKVWYDSVKKICMVEFLWNIEATILRLIKTCIDLPLQLMFTDKSYKHQSTMLTKS